MDFCNLLSINIYRNNQSLAAKFYENSAVKPREFCRQTPSILSSFFLNEHKNTELSLQIVHY